MAKSFRSRMFCAGLFFLCPLLFGQTFQVTGRSVTGGDATLLLDQTRTITFQVQGTNVPNVVTPRLQVASGVSSTLANAVSVTWNSSAPIVNWGSGVQNITFFVHLYDQPGACAQNVDFDLFFESPQLANPVQASVVGQNLRFGTSSNDVITLDQEISRINEQPDFPLDNGRHDYFLTVNPSITSAMLNDPNNRIYFYIDYHCRIGNQAQVVSTTPEIYFDFLLYFLSPNGPNVCRFNFLEDAINQNNIVDGMVVDTTAPGGPVSFQTARYGGDGNGPFDYRLGVNLFDITDVDLFVCSGTPRQNIVNNFGQLYECTISVDTDDGIIREVKLMLGRESGCFTTSNAFFSPPSFNDFRIDDVFISSIGDVQASLTVPSGAQGWRTTAASTTLKSDYRVSWFLRRNDTVIALGGETQNLVLDTNTPVTINDPSGYYLEARIRHLPSNSWVSADSSSYNHNYSYQLDPGQVVFENAEQNFGTGAPAPDQALDPGEILRLPYVIDDPDNGPVTVSLFVETGYVVDLNSNGQIDGSDRFVNANQAQPGVNLRILPVTTSTDTIGAFDVRYELLQAEQSDRIWFYIDTEHTDSSTGQSSIFRRYTSLNDLLGLSIVLNTENTELISSYDFGVANGGWVAGSDTVTDGAAGGWTYTGQRWQGDGPDDPAFAQTLYSIRSPVLPVGLDSAMEFRHRPDFTFNQSGGILEYRIWPPSPGVPTPWTNFITAACPSCDIYDPITFPDNIDSYLAGQQVWMGLDNSQRLDALDIPNSFVQNLFPGQDQIQFRFAFQDPSLNPTPPTDSSGPTQWDVLSFSYSTFQLLSDNVFGFDPDLLTLDACAQSLSLGLLPNAPVAVNNLTFRWHESLTDLYLNPTANSPVVGPLGLNVPFSQPTPGTYNYFVEVSFNGTVRLVAVTVTKTMGCPDCLTCNEALQQIYDDVSSGQWPQPKSILDCVQLINQICEGQQTCIPINP